MRGSWRHSWLRSATSPTAALVAFILLLGVGGFLLTSLTIRHDQDAAAARRAEVEAVQTQEVLGRARAYVAGLADVLAGEAQPGQAKFARWARGTAAGVGLNDVLWVQSIPASQRADYERRRHVTITRLTPSGRFVAAPPARSFLPATFTSRSRPELRPGVDVTSFPGLGQAIGDRARIFAVGASRPGAIGGEPGFFLLEAAAFARGPDSRGYLAAFVPRGWFSSSLGGDPRRIAISQDGRRIEGRLDSVQADARFELLGRQWRIDVAREPRSGLQSLLPWLAFAWPFAVAGIVYAIARATTLRRRAQREVERIFDLSLDLITLVGFDGRYKAVNPAWEQTLGYSSQQTIGRPFAGFVHPDDLEASREAFAAVLDGGAVNQFENRMIRADGSARWLQWIGRPMPEQGVIYATGRDVTELRIRDREQAALRRVATLIAREASQDEVFTAIAEEAAQLLGAEHVQMLRYEQDDSAVVVASAGEALPAGSRHPLGGENLTSLVFRTGAPARVDDYGQASGAIAEAVRTTVEIRSAVAAPILVKHRLWGVLVASTAQAEALPAETESRLAQFTELVATAIANADARGEVQRLAEEQAALRRVATLVAEGASPGAVLDAVVAEMDALLDADQVALNRFEPEDEMVVLAQRGLDPERTRVGSRISTAGESVAAKVRRTGLPARMEGYDEARGELADLARIAGLRSAVSAPIVVEGGLWGLITAGWKGERSPPADTEERMVRFAQLLDTAIANADSRDQLTASRARLLTAGDEARRRVVRDLHDGAQQRLVHTVVALKLARRAFREDGDMAESLVGGALENAERCTTELRELAHGILPTSLTRGGLRAAIDSRVERLSLPIDVEVPSERFPAEIEASTYFIVAEALTNIVKHSHASRAQVRVAADDGTLRVEVRDDGTGGADPGGHGLVGMADRVTALGGRLEITSPPGGGTLVAATLPLSGS